MSDKQNNDQELVALQQELAMMVNATATRLNLYNGLRKGFDGDRDYDDAFGYPETLTFKDYDNAYERNGLAKTIINKPADSTWRDEPSISVTDEDGEADREASKRFSLEWGELTKRLRLYHYLHRLDKLSRIGDYGVMLLGMSDDQEDWTQPVVNAQDIMYLSVFKQNKAIIESMETNKNDPRYGMPAIYRLSISDANGGEMTERVHWSRIIHVASDLQESEYKGTPALKALWNRLIDLKKIVGGSAEMFWLGARPGYNFNMDADADVSDSAKEDMKNQLENFRHGLTRMLRLQGVSAESLQPQPSDPSKDFEMQMSLVSAISGIPKRILLGSERGELASSQDETNWNKQIDGRRSSVATPQFLRPFIDRMMDFGILSPVNYQIEWPEQDQLSEKDKATIAKDKMEALKKYTEAPDAELVYPREAFMREILGWSNDSIEWYQGMIDNYLEDELAAEKEAQREAEEIRNRKWEQE